MRYHKATKYGMGSVQRGGGHRQGQSGVRPATGTARNARTCRARRNTTEDRPMVVRVQRCSHMRQTGRS
eukprot:45097-Eustigmatos_ZCMA.PRE.1